MSKVTKVKASTGKAVSSAGASKAVTTGNYNLVIVESPAKCKKIEEYLNRHPQTVKPYKCLASFGHIRELAGGLAAINILQNFSPTFTECESKKEQITKLRKAIKEAGEVILASDDDREGEAIAWHLCQAFHLPVETTKRILFHEITETALHRAIENPTRVNMATVHAQLARQVLDVLVGYKLSPLLWKHVKDGLSAGRCQTPALRLIYENQREIDQAPGKQSYTVTGYFTNKTLPFVLNHEETDAGQLEAFLKESQTHSHLFTGCQLKTKSRPAPSPFSTSTLQQAASNELHIAPKETMSICQKLYEEGHITYPRTDSHTYCKEFLLKAAAYITEKYGEKYLAQAKEEKNEKDKDNAHEAIRPTNLKCEQLDTADATPRENRVYRLIYERTLESCMAAASVSVLSATISAPQNREYHYSTEHLLFAGWKSVSLSSTGTGTSVSSSTGDYTYLQSLKSNLSLPFKKIKATVHLKELKAHYTEARLVQLLEEKSIGRPSTFSSLVEKIQERKYVKKEHVNGKMIKCIEYELEASTNIITQTTAEREFGAEKSKLVIQPVGTMALEFLLTHFEPFFTYAYTKEMEEGLDAVATGTTTWQDLCRKCNDEIEHLSSAILERGKEMIRIDDQHTYMIGKHGPVIKCTSKAANASAAGTSAAGTSAAGKASKAANATFKAVRPDIDLQKLRRGEYTLDELLVSENTPASIGLYQEKPVYIKVGKFGKYLEWNGLIKSLKHLKQAPSEITLDDVTELLFDGDNELEHTRILTPDATIKKSKYGYYIYYKNPKMKKPRFLKLDDFPGGDYMTCELAVVQEWFKTKYQIE